MKTYFLIFTLFISTWISSVALCQTSVPISLSTRQVMELPIDLIADKVLGKDRPNIEYLSRPRGPAVNSELHRIVLISSPTLINKSNICKVDYFDILFGQAITNPPLGIDALAPVVLINKELRYKAVLTRYGDKSIDCNAVKSVESFFKWTGSTPPNKILTFLTKYNSSKGYDKYNCSHYFEESHNCNTNKIELIVSNLVELDSSSCSDPRNGLCITATFAPDGIDNGFKTKVQFINLSADNQNEFATTANTKLSFRDIDISIN